MDTDAFLQTPVRDAMREVLTALTPETSLQAAAQLFADRHVTGAPVVTADGVLVGVMSRTDLLAPAGRRSDRTGNAEYYVMLHGERQLSATVPAGDRSTPGVTGVVGDVMTRLLITVTPDAPLREAIALMVGREVHRVLVVDNGRLLGVVSAMDVLRVLVPPAGPRDSDGF